LAESKISRTLRVLTREETFYFFTSIGKYTGQSADSLEEFIEKILVVDTKSLEFHLYRGDFEHWIAGALEDNELASKIKRLKESKPIGKNLRDRLYLIVSKHYNSLTSPHQDPAQHEFMLNKARKLMSELPPTRFELKLGQSVKLEESLIAKKTADGKIVLEVVE
jgi:hypothetical protein